MIFIILFWLTRWRGYIMSIYLILVDQMERIYHVNISYSGRPDGEDIISNISNSGRPDGEDIISNISDSGRPDGEDIISNILLFWSTRWRRYHIQYTLILVDQMEKISYPIYLILVDQMEIYIMSSILLFWSTRWRRYQN